MDQSRSNLEAERQRQIELNLQLPPVKRRAHAKHVSRACLNCRKRHFKCNGELPVCEKCQTLGTICTYVQSHRGGARKKGVKISSASTPEIEDLPSAKGTDDGLYKLPCEIRCSQGQCPGKDGQSKGSAANCKCPEELLKKVKAELNDETFGLKVQNYANLFTLDYDEEDMILTNFYNGLYNAHPFVPPRQELIHYFKEPTIRKEMLHIMKIISEGQNCGIYHRNHELIADHLVQCVEVIKSHNFKDIVSLQSLLLVSMIGHISALHEFSQNIRQYCIQMIEELGINIVDAKINISPPETGSPSSGDIKLPVFLSSRMAHIPQESIKDSGRRLFWELIFFDVITGSADGKTLTNLASIRTEVNYPNFPPANVFDYKGRAEAALLVNKAIKLNLAIINKKPLDKHLRSLKIAISTMEMRISDPTSYNAPSLTSINGLVNEGVHQSILLFNYARIFVHRPFSYLWKIKSPQVPKCGGEAQDARAATASIKGEELAVIETQKTMQAADSIVQVLMNTNASNILKRTPLVACALALSSLVHLSAYIWIENSLQESQQTGFNSDDLLILADYIQLSISAIYPISKHWILSGRLARHIRDTVSKLRPELFAKMISSLPSFEEEEERTPSVKEETPQQFLKPLTETRTQSVRAPIEAGTPSQSLRTSIDGGTPSQSIRAPTSTVSDTDSSRDFERLENDHIGLVQPPVSFKLEPRSQMPSILNNDDFNDDLIDGDTGCDWIDKALMDYFEDDFTPFGAIPSM